VEFHHYYLEARLIEQSLINSARTKAAELLRASQLCLQYTAAQRRKPHDGLTNSKEQKS